MQTSANHPPSPFAGVLAAAAAPTRKSAPAWDDELADDVISLSYERALSTHARYRGSARNDCALTDLPSPEPPRTAAAPLPQAPASPAAAPGARNVPLPLAPEKHRKDASITVRFSSEECEQLHRRAQQAGLTVSAYLRSCTLEAETLRALVKSTLAQMQNPSQAPSAAEPSASRPKKPRSAWLRNLLPQRQRAARA